MRNTFPRRSSGHGFRRTRSRGQVVVVFAAAIVVLIALCGVVIDVAWYWTGNLRMQRAADAAALAGVVWLPGNPSQAITVARAEASKNGYAHGTGGVVVTPSVDPHNDRRLNVSISGTVGTFFSGVVGVNSWPAQRTAKADYVLPVPMGSPDNYYGVGYLVKPETTTTTNTTHSTGDTGWDVATGTAPSGGQWSQSATGSGRTITTMLNQNNNEYAQETTNGHQQQWANFGLLSGGSAIPSPGGNQVLTITGIEVRLQDAFVSASCPGSTIGVDLSWNGGGSWSTRVTTPSLGTSTTNGDYTLPTTNLAAWGSRTWARNDFSDASFRVRFTANKGCGSSSTSLNVDMLEVRVSWDLATTTTTTTTVLIDDAPVPPPPGQAAITRPQKFWGAMQSQGAPNIQGDAFMTKYSTRKSVTNAVGGTDPDTYYDYNDYYNYAVEIPAGGGGTVWVYDPGFCDGTSSAGTGEYWTVGGSNGASSRNPISAYFDLLNTHQTMLDTSDDTLVASTGNTYRRLSYEDHVIFGAKSQSTNVAGDCSSQSWHFGWVQLATGLAAGTYRLHTYSTDKSALNDQDDATALNSFALYASASGGTPRVYGIGAMEAYVRLPANQASEFYLAQIDAVHAGKTMVINLWDPGDTGNLSASLEILKPTGSGFTPVQFDYDGTPANASASNCNSNNASNVWAVTTNTGGTSLFNGCWLTLEIQIPTSYTAPNDPASGEDGWWKIRYTMGNQSGSGATDLTTWKVDIRGNPVHLVAP